MQRRHNEFRRLLLGNQMTSTPLAPSLLIPAESVFSNLQVTIHILSTNLIAVVIQLSWLFVAHPFTHSVFQEDQHQRELSVLRRRLEDLEYSQQQQLEELAPPLDRERDSQAHGTPFLTSDLS